MTDLQCPARVYVARCGGAADELAAALAGERVARVWSGPVGASLAGQVAERLGCGTSVEVELDRTEADVPAAGPVLLEGLPGAFTGIEDLHRGEAVLVILPAADPSEPG